MQLVDYFKWAKGNHTACEYGVEIIPASKLEQLKLCVYHMILLTSAICMRFSILCIDIHGIMYGIGIEMHLKHYRFPHRLTPETFSLHITSLELIHIYIRAAQFSNHRTCASNVLEWIFQVKTFICVIEAFLHQISHEVAYISQ